jgi:hypothetical protein
MSGFAAKLLITDGTATGTVDLLSPASGFSLQSWIPAIPAIKGGGTWQDSPLANGRKPIHRRWANTSETFELAIRNFQQDAVIRDTQILRRLLEKAAQYWTTEWQDEMVWIEARGPCETNSRYALIYDWRTPQDGNPYTEPFQNPGVIAGFESFPLILERGFWTDSPPGTGECVEISAVQSFCWPWYLEFNGTTSEVNCGNGAQIDDLHSGTFTAEAWIYLRSWGEGLQGRIFDKDNYTGAGINVGWHFLVDSGVGLWAACAAGTTNALSKATASDLGSGDFGQWIHVAMTYNNGGNRLIRMWVKGIEVTYTTQNAAVGLIKSDVGENLFIGNTKTQARTFDGYIGWSRVSSTIRYATATFTPPTRCTLPNIDAFTAGQWIGVESSGAIIDNQEGTAAYDGTQSNCLFGCDCEFEYGNTDGATCDDEVFIANKHNMANITDIYYYDALPAGFSANLMFAALPYAFLPAVTAVGDIVYFGINTALADSGPFCSLVFDIGTAQNDLTITWEYWSSAGPGWAALSVRDNTNAGGAGTGQPFDTTGVNSVHWTQPSDWVTTAVNGVTGYWVRARVTAIGGAPSPPTQQNRDIYSIVWPYVEIAETEVGGDIAALILAQLHNVSSEAFVTDAWTNKCIAGVRSISRGEDFTAYINAADEQNDPGITITLAGATTVFANDVTSPTGRRVTHTPTAVGTTISAIRILFSSQLSTQYYGRYHAFLRAQQASGVSGDIEARLELHTGGSFLGQPAFASDWAIAPITGDIVSIDFGRFLIPGTSTVNVTEPVEDMYIVVAIRNSNPAYPPIYIYDLILMPADEFIIESTDPFGYANGDGRPTSAGNEIDDLLSIDSISYPKKTIRTQVESDSLSEVRTIYRPVSSGPIGIQANADQRLWFYADRIDSVRGEWIQKFEIAHAVEIYKNQRYFSMRGAR